MLKGDSREFKDSFKDVVNKSQGCLKKVSSVFQKNFIKNLKGVSIIF